MKVPVAPSFCRYGWMLLAYVGILLSLGRATTVIPPNFTAMVNGSDYVVRAVVKSTSAEEQATADSRKIYTHVELEVLQVIAGQPPASVVLRFLGGRVGDRELVVDGSPALQVGEECILFVKGNGRMLCPVYAMSYGAFPIKKDPVTKRLYVTREDQAPLARVDEISQPLGQTAANLPAAERMLPARGMTPDEFTRQIQAVRQPETQQNAKLN